MTVLISAARNAGQPASWGDTGIISGAILYIKKDFAVSQFGEGLIVAAGAEEIV